MTVGKIKRYIGKHSQPPLALASMQLKIGDDALVDTWTGEDFGLADGSSISLYVSPAPDSTASAQAADVSPPMAVATPRQEAVQQRVEKRLALRRIFQDCSGGGVVGVNQFIEALQRTELFSASVKAGVIRALRVRDN